MRGAAAGLILILAFAQPVFAQSIDDDIDIDRQGTASMEECLRDPDNCDLADMGMQPPAAEAPSPEPAIEEYYEEPASEPEPDCPEGDAACDDRDG